MKTKKEKKEVRKFDLERFEVAKLKNLHLIVGGGDEPIEITKGKNGGSSRGCN